MYFMQALKVGDVVGISLHSYRHPSPIVEGTVTKTTKTTVTVTYGMDNVCSKTFNITSARERGGDKWTSALLVPEPELRKAQEYRRLNRIKEAKMSRRDLALRRLQAANGAGDDAAFALALEALAQQEYAP